MKISVIIPSYKPKDYLWKCLDSFCNQTFPKADYEIIIVLNGCREPYYSEIEHYIAYHQPVNWNLIQTDKGGVSNARNIAICAACGEYVCFIDDDDWVTDNYLEELYAASAKSTIVVSNVQDYDETTQSYREGYIGFAFKQYSNTANLSVLCGKHFLSSSCCKIIPKDIIGSRRFVDGVTVGEDALFMATLSDEIRNIRLADENVIYYRRIRKDSAQYNNVSMRFKIKNRWLLTRLYTKTYFTDVSHYNVLLFLDRMLAIWKWLFVK